MQDWRLEVEGGLARLWIARPHKRNAISLPMWAALPGLLGELAAEPDIAILTLRGEGGVFSGGADIEEFKTAYATQEAALANHSVLQGAMSALERFPKPSVAVLEGPSVGAGLGLALCCDVRIAAADARFAITPARLGLLYAFGDVRRLVEAVGLSRAKLLLLTARTIDAETALAWGLVDEVAADLDAALARLNSELLEAAPFTRSALKRLFQLLRQGQREESEETRVLFAEGFSGPDFAEGYAAFKERRKPRFRS